MNRAVLEQLYATRATVVDDLGRHDQVKDLAEGEQAAYAERWAGLVRLKTVLDNLIDLMWGEDDTVTMILKADTPPNQKTH